MTDDLMVQARVEEAEDQRIMIASPDRESAIEYLRGYIFGEDLLSIREAIEKDPKKWWASYHLGWGMYIRNVLRRAGFGEEKLGVRNLDNVYVDLVKAAVMETDDGG